MILFKKIKIKIKKKKTLELTVLGLILVLSSQPDNKLISQWSRFNS